MWDILINVVNRINPGEHCDILSTENQGYTLGTMLVRGFTSPSFCNISFIRSLETTANDLARLETLRCKQ
jgi:hypothetical protein